jgi:octaprenyl-diphosphate synthase
VQRVNYPDHAEVSWWYFGAGRSSPATEIVFRRHLASDVPFIQKARRRNTSPLPRSGGKRVRPALLLLASRLLGHDGEEEVTYAAVVEFIHTATLIHDDIIDHATLRRGRPRSTSCGATA